MRALFSELERWRHQGEQIALATLVRVRGSAPRRPGARLGLTRSGQMVGSVSAGCVENDVFDRAMRVLDEDRPVLAGYGIDDELGMQVGLSCGGSIEVWIEPFAPTPAWEAVRGAVEGQRPAALATAIAPEDLHTKCLAILDDGAVVGAIDPSLDQGIAAEARGLLALGETRLLDLPWRKGTVAIFLQAFPPPRRLFILGATQTAVVLCRLAAQLGYRVIVVDARSPFASPERFPEADEVVRAWPDEILAKAGLDTFSYVVTLTHDLKFDVPALAQALRSDARYIGALGSRRTHERRKAKLRQAGVSEDRLDLIHAPVGLDLGGQEPEEIALAIVAEIQAVRYGNHRRSLRAGSGPVHDGD